MNTTIKRLDLEQIMDALDSIEYTSLSITKFKDGSYEADMTKDGWELAVGERGNSYTVAVSNLLDLLD